ncbi:nucleotidyltransferase family protein [Flavobacterium sp.]|uniref:nucleotidyltransferase family protein n=1 Tax=Flavobacterium sp. TaxID=239 RepID=UPI002FDB1C1E
MTDRFILKDDSTLYDVLRILDSNGNGFLPIVNDEDQLLGIITDGDLRRGILNKTIELEAIINKSPITAKYGTSHVVIKKQLREIHRRQMPVVDENNKLIEIVVLDEFEFVPKDNWVVIMAGGLGSRLGELTRDTPKPMLNVGGKSILQGIIEHFKSQGYCKFVLCLNFKAEIIEDYFQNGDWLGVEIKYTKEQKRLGTAGALSLIDFPIENSFFVVNGDVLTTINYEEFMKFHKENNSMASMCIKKLHFEVPYACVEFDTNKDLNALREKPSFDYFINTGIYVLEPAVLEKIPKDGFFDMPQLFQQLLEEKFTTKVFEMEDYWLDLGKLEDFNKGNRDLNIE